MPKFDLSRIQKNRDGEILRISIHWIHGILIQFQDVLGIDLYRRITLSLPHCAKGDTQKQKSEMARSSVLKLTKNGTNSLALYRFHRSHCHHHTGTDWAKHSKTIHLKGVRFMPKITMTVLLTYKFKIVLYLCFHTKRAAWIDDSINISIYVVIPHWQSWVIGFSSYRSPKMGSIPTLSRRSSRRPDQTLVVIQNESSFEKTRWILKRLFSSHPQHFTTRRSVSVIADARSLAMRGEQRKRKRKGGKDEL